MAKEFKAASIFAELGFKINKQELKQLKEFKDGINEVKKSLGSKTSTAGIVRTTAALKKQGAANKKIVADLRIQNTIKKAELDLEKRLAKVSAQRRGTERSAFGRAKKGLLADPTSKGMSTFRDKATAIKIRADEHAIKAETKAIVGKAKAIDKVAAAQKRQAMIAAQAKFKGAVSGLTAGPNARLKDMAKHYKQEERAANAAAKAIEREAKAQARGAAQAARRAMVQRNLNQKMRDFRTTLMRSTQAYTAYATLVNTARVDTQLEEIQAQFTSVFGKNAGDEMSYVSQEAHRLGNDLLEVSKSYAKFTFSAQQMNFTAEESRLYFQRLQEAGVGLGLSQDQIIGTMKALEQSMAKGYLQAEELKGQLGDRLPGAVGIAAKAMGITTDELMKRMENGQVAVEEFIGPFTKAIRELAEPGLKQGLNTVGKFFTRFQNQVVQVQGAFMGGGFGNAIKSLLVGFTNILKIAEPVMALLGGALGAFIEDMTFPLRLVFALVLDIANLIGGAFGWSIDDMNDKFGATGRILGHIAAFLLGGGLIKMGIRGIVKTARVLEGILARIVGFLQKMGLFKGAGADGALGAIRAGGRHARRAAYRGASIGPKLGASIAGGGEIARGTGLVDKVDVNVFLDGAEKWLNTKVDKRVTSRKDRRR